MTIPPSFILQPAISPREFDPAPGQRCYCPSRKAFGKCCGSRESARSAPYGLFLFENKLDKAMASDLTAYARDREGKPLKVIDPIASTANNVVKVEDATRVAERVDLGDRRDNVIRTVKSLFVELAQSCYGVTLDWFESPDLMRYRRGGFYHRHADSENRDPGTRLWNKIIDRDLSLIIYLNSSFSGGRLYFHKFNYRIRPRIATVIIFPSDHRFVHQIETVTAGERYAIVSWASVHGVAKIAEKPAGNVISLE